MQDNTCTTTGCTNTVLAKHLCRSHYMARRATQMPPCEVDCCTKPQDALGLCQKHYSRSCPVGPLGYTLPLLGPNPPPHITHPKCSYLGMHERIKNLYGKANTHPCTTCGQPANSWSYDHQDPNEVTGVMRNERDGERPVQYSLNPNHYNPLCNSCHARLDANPKPTCINRHDTTHPDSRDRGSGCRQCATERRANTPTAIAKRAREAANECRHGHNLEDNKTKRGECRTCHNTSTRRAKRKARERDAE